MTPEHEEEFADPRIERRFRNLYEDVSNGLNPHFYSPLSDEVLSSFDSMKRHYLLFEFLKTFIERLGCSFMHADCINIVWDALLTKPTREENDMYLVWSLSAIVACLKDKGFLPRRDSVSQKLIDDNYCGSLVDFIALIEAKGPTVHEVDFFRTYRKLFTKVDTSVQKNSIISDDPLKYPTFENEVEECKKINHENVNVVFETFDDTKRNIVAQEQAKKESIKAKAVM